MDDATSLPPPTRKTGPLTDGQIAVLIHKIIPLEGRCDVLILRNFVRAIERAHGIGE